MQGVALLMLVIAIVKGSNIKQYIYFELEKSWEEARDYCEHNGTKLAFIDSQSDQDDLERVAEGANFTQAWIDLPQDFSDMDHLTAQPRADKYTNWQQDSQPPPREKKVAIKRDGKWCGLKGTETLPFFCVSVYGVKETKKSWEEALQHCGEAGSHLFWLGSQKTSNPTGESLWVGLRFLAGGWLWVHAQPLQHQAWSMAVAEGPQDHQCPLTTRCGALSPEGVREARDCKDKLGFICNKQIQ